MADSTSTPRYIIDSCGMQTPRVGSGFHEEMYIADFTIKNYGDVCSDIYAIDANNRVKSELMIGGIVMCKITTKSLSNKLNFYDGDLRLSHLRFSPVTIRMYFVNTVDCEKAKIFAVHNFIESSDKTSETMFKSGVIFKYGEGVENPSSEYDICEYNATHYKCGDNLSCELHVMPKRLTNIHIKGIKYDGSVNGTITSNGTPLFTVPIRNSEFIPWKSADGQWSLDMTQMPYSDIKLVLSGISDEEIPTVEILLTFDSVKNADSHINIQYPKASKEIFCEDGMLKILTK